MAVVAQQASDYKLFSRVANYSLVSSVLEKSKDYYTWGKESSKVFAFAESSLEGGFQWLNSSVNPLWETTTYKTYAKPLLVKADSFGNSALDTVETNAKKLKTNYDNTKQVVEDRVSSVKTATYGALEQAQQKLVKPVDNYLKDSLVAKPYSFALDVTEKVVDRILPAEEAKKVEVSGPISRTTHLSFRVQQQAFSKLQNLTLRTPERLHALEYYTVDLIKYAAHTLDNGVYSLGQSVGKGVTTGTTLVKEAPKEVKEKVQKVTHDTIAALNAAIDVISTKLPTPVSSRLKQLTEAAKQEGKHELNVFTSVAQSSSKLLHDIGDTFLSYAHKGEAVPQQLLSSALSSLHKVLDSLLLLKKSVTEKEHKETNGESLADNIGASN